MELSNRILENFDYSKENIDEFSLGYKAARFITNQVELLAYSMKTKDFIFFVDKNKVENFISVYEAQDRTDDSKGVVIEMMIGESKQKEIIFIEDNKLYIITETKWGKIIDTTIIEDESKATQLLEIVNNDLKFLRKKVDKYKNKLKYKGCLQNEVSDKVLENFKLKFMNMKLQTS